MPYLRRATDNPFGLIPFGAVLRVGKYRKGSDTNADIFPGDLVVMASDGQVDDLGAATTTSVLGVAAAYYASGSASNEVLVYDHPDQLFSCQDDGDTSNMAATSIGNNVAPIGFTGDSTLLRSITELDASTADTGVRMLKVVDLHPIENNSFASAAGNPRKWVVKINPYFHYHASANAV